MADRVGVDSRRQIINHMSPAAVLLLSLVLFLGLCVNVVDLYRQRFYLLVLPQLHLTDEVRNYQVNQRVGCDLVSELV
jgi:hypothetical protein